MRLILSTLLLLSIATCLYLSQALQAARGDAIDTRARLGTCVALLEAEAATTRVCLRTLEDTADAVGLWVQR